MPLVLCKASQFDCLNPRNTMGPKSHVTPHFDHLDLRNAMVPPKESPKECDSAIDDTIDIT